MTNPIGKTRKTLKIKGRSSSSKRIVVNSDLHVGSNFAITSANGPDQETRWQKVLREFWLETSDKVGHHDLHVINGENLNGVNKKNNGAENYTSDISAQRRHSIDAVLEWNFDEILVTRGSGYHSSDGGWTWYEEDFAEDIGAVVDGEYKGEYTDEESGFIANGKVFNLAHHVPGSNWFHYSTTPLTREGMGLSLNRTKYYDESEVRHIDVVIRSHRHYRILIDIGRTMLCQTPCWQFRNRYMKRTGMGTLYPTIGTIWFDVEPDGEILYHYSVLPDERIPKKELLHL